MIKNAKYLAIILISLSINGCDWFIKSSDSNQSESESTSETVVKRDYKLHGDEVEPRITFGNVTRLTNSTMEIEGVDNFLCDPYALGYFYGEVTVRYPSNEQIAGRNIVYTSNWYSRYTLSRNGCYEMAIQNFDGSWVISEINNNGHTFIPFNGAVISFASSISGYEVGDFIDITNDTIKTDYVLGLYNQNDYRLAVNTIDDGTWASGINLYTQNTLTSVTSSPYEKYAIMNFDFNEKTNSFRVDRSRVREKDGRTFLNIQDGGFALASSISEGTIAASLMNGVRFSENDTIKIEENGNYSDCVANLTIGSNTYQTNSGKTISFNMTKSTSSLTTNKWGLEIAIDKSGYVYDYGVHVNIPTDGYKFALTCQSGSNSEDLQMLVKTLFQKGNQVKIKSNAVSITESVVSKTSNMWQRSTIKVEDDLESLEYHCVDYDLNTLLSIQDSLNNIKTIIDKKAESEDPTDHFYLYTLYGACYNLYAKLSGMDTKNEAVSVRTTWYIIDFGGRDKDLSSIQKELDILKNAGMNEIVISPLNKGKAYYLDSDILSVSNEISGKNYGEYGGDYLKAVIGEAHKRNINVMANFLPFSMGLEKAFSELNDCKALSIKGETSVTTSQGTVEMLDPASDKVQNKIAAVINDFMTHNDFDGVTLDYIRYGADNNALSTVMGVTEDARIKFNAYCSSKSLPYSYSTLAALRTGLSNGTVFSYFNLFEQTLIYDTVKNAKTVLKNYKKPLCAAIADDYNYVKTWKCQDWGSWAKDGIIDGLYVMDYYFDTYYVDYYVKDVVTNTKNSETTLIVGAVDPSYAALNEESYIKTVQGALKNQSSHGFGIFGTHTQAVRVDGWDLVAINNYRESINPFDTLQETMKASSDLLLDRAERIYKKYGFQDDTQFTSLKNDLDSLYNSILGDDAFSCNNVITKIDKMLENTYASGEAQDRIIEQLTYMRKIVTVKLNVVK